MSSPKKDENCENNFNTIDELQRLVKSEFEKIRHTVNTTEQRMLNHFVSLSSLETDSSFDSNFVITAADTFRGISRSIYNTFGDTNDDGKKKKRVVRNSKTLSRKRQNTNASICNNKKDFRRRLKTKPRNVTSASIACSNTTISSHNAKYWRCILEKNKMIIYKPRKLLLNCLDVVLYSLVVMFGHHFHF